MRCATRPAYWADKKDPPRTRQSRVTLAAFPPWGSWPGWRHAGSRRPFYPFSSSGEALSHRLDRSRERRAFGSRVRFHEVARAFECRVPWRIRLVAYGARLESVLGASPRGFESPIL